jgi:hypothetical protein
MCFVFCGVLSDAWQREAEREKQREEEEARQQEALSRGDQPLPDVVEVCA